MSAIPAHSDLRSEYATGHMATLKQRIWVRAEYYPATTGQGANIATGILWYLWR